jgi:hypothetical protein
VGSKHAGAVIRFRVACAGALLLATFGPIGCKRGGSDAECLAARARAREAATEGELERASTLVDEARASCGSKAQHDIQRIQGVIDSRRRAQADQARVEARGRAEIERFPVRSLLDWTKLGVINPEVTELSCAPRDSDDYGFCQGHRRGQPKMTLRYWDSQRDAFRYTYSTELPLSCVDAGEHRRVRSWSRDGKSYELCELTQHEVRSLSALLEQAPGESTIYVYSQAYLQKDRAFSRLVSGGG